MSGQIRIHNLPGEWHLFIFTYDIFHAQIVGMQKSVGDCWCDQSLLREDVVNTHMHIHAAIVRVHTDVCANMATSTIPPSLVQTHMHTHGW